MWPEGDITVCEVIMYQEAGSNEPVVELRPISNRTLFAGISGNRYILLHAFQNKTQKTPKREIKKAKKELADYRERYG